MRCFNRLVPQQLSTVTFKPAAFALLTTTVLTLFGGGATSARAQLFLGEVNGAQGTGRIETAPAAGGLHTVFATGLLQPEGMAFGPDGRLYVADSLAKTIVRYDVSTGQSQVFASGFSQPNGVAFAPNGDLFVADQGGGTVWRVSPAGVRNSFSTAIFSPVALAFNGADDLFVSNGATVFRLTPQAQISTFATGFAQGFGLAFSPADDLFVANRAGAQSVVRVSSGGAVTTFATPLGNPLGLAFAPNGDLFVARSGVGTIYAYDPAGLQRTVAAGVTGVEYLAQASTPVPEPATIGLLLLGGVAILVRRQRRGLREQTRF